MLHFSRWKTITVVLVCLSGILLALPNLFSASTLAGLTGWLPHKQVHLGLDLQGGSHLLLEMNTRQIEEEWLDSIRDEVRKRLRKAKIGYTGLRIVKDHVQVRIKKPEQFGAAYKELRGIIERLSGSIFTGSGGADLEVTRAVAAGGKGDLIFLRPTDAAMTERISNAINSALETVRRRIDALGTTEPMIQRQGRARILVQVPGLDDPQKLKALIGETAKLDFRLVHPTITPSEVKRSRVPPGWKLFPSADGFAGSYLLRSRAIVSGEDLVDAQPSFDGRTNEPVVTFRFNASGARRFGRVTQANVGRPFAIVLDGKVISAPVIREPILGGSGQISGSFTVETATKLAIQLSSGALPADMEIVEERTVGPSLGADSIAAGEIAAMVGLLTVIAFMLFAYGQFGVFSDIALLLNLGLIIGVLSLLQATLTLPGIAGIVLTIGMAVDANVLIFERIREEVRAGKSAINAIDSGYSRALGTILDANITTFIAAVILFWLGSGPIRGFAVTLSIGIMTSVFTAFTVTRLMVALWLRSQGRRAVEVPI